MMTANDWIERLGLVPHPEGGWFKEVYGSHERIVQDALPERFAGARVFSTAIYFLLNAGEVSRLHRIQQDEIWHFYDGDPILIYVIDDNGILTTFTLGLSPENNIMPQVTINANHWFAAESLGDYSLVGCTVSPGFDFQDFEIAERNSLINLYYKHKEIIEKLTRTEN